MSLTPFDLERLVQIVTEEVVRAHGGVSSTPACACHGVLADCCPDRLRGVLDAGATRLGLRASGAPAGDVAALIDHTLLKADATQEEIDTLCREAREYRFATVCVNPTWVPRASRALRGSGVGVCTVVGFPLGATTPDVKAYETRRVIFDGATEVDMVINIGALKSGDLRTVQVDIEAVVDVCRAAGVTSKVIIETALLTDDEKVTASTLSKAAGADFVKTSTGFAKTGAISPARRRWCRQAPRASARALASGSSPRAAAQLPAPGPRRATERRSTEQARAAACARSATSGLRMRRTARPCRTGRSCRTRRSPHRTASRKSAS
jgi:deoxyribose-phosphate aldolase